MKGTLLSFLASCSAIAAQMTIAPEVFHLEKPITTGSVYSAERSLIFEEYNRVVDCGGEVNDKSSIHSGALPCICCSSGTPMSPRLSTCSTHQSSGGTAFATGDAGYKGDATNYCTQKPAPAACTKMNDIFTSCQKATESFISHELSEQASCLCCNTNAGTTSWTNALGPYASTCAAWGKTAHPKNAYSYAHDFAQLCDKWTNVCAPATGTSDDDSSTITTETSQSSEPVTVSVTKTFYPTETGSVKASDNSGISLYVGSYHAVLLVLLTLTIGL
ncbi:hypothetical protein BGZ63DRAFT_404961 [Mariannaea sp. PMI_226]|nr:hypothetical protein BGZ63DRAFT_404961 [Mariannaea sp. PMI_226]